MRLPLVAVLACVLISSAQCQGVIEFRGSLTASEAVPSYSHPAFATAQFTLDDFVLRGSVTFEMDDRWFGTTSCSIEGPMAQNTSGPVYFAMEGPFGVAPGYGESGYTIYGLTAQMTASQASELRSGMLYVTLSSEDRVSALRGRLEAIPEPSAAMLGASAIAAVLIVTVLRGRHTIVSHPLK